MNEFKNGLSNGLPKVCICRFLKLFPNKFPEQIYSKKFPEKYDTNMNTKKCKLVWLGPKGPTFGLIGPHGCNL